MGRYICKVNKLIPIYQISWWGYPALVSDLSLLTSMESVLFIFLFFEGFFYLWMMSCSDKLRIYFPLMEVRKSVVLGNICSAEEEKSN